ncbi:DUF6417 family protein [Streptomyces avermitilis]|uniref:DUF6417 family protein n=1 Tax=Streptomyces avermitilis TaxID=33903 RepID=UPI00381AD8E8
MCWRASSSTWRRSSAGAECLPSCVGVGSAPATSSSPCTLQVFVRLTGRLRVSPADGLAEQVRLASCDHGIKRWRLCLTQEQMESVAYGLWLHRMMGSTAEASRFGREYGIAHTPGQEDALGSSPDLPRPV